MISCDAVNFLIIWPKNWQLKWKLDHKSHKLNQINRFKVVIHACYKDKGDRYEMGK